MDTAAARPLQGRPLWIVVAEAVAVGAFAVLWVAVALRVALAGSAFELLAWTALALVPAVALADFATGFVHWFADTFFEEDTPGIGPIFIAAFREHHRQPRAMAEHGAIAVLGNGCFAILPFLFALLALPVANAPLRAVHTLALLTLLAAGLTNLFHCWAHSEIVPRPVAWLQRRALILSPERHAVHHGARHDSVFCVTTGWLNPWLDRRGFFAKLERAVRSGLAKRDAAD